MRIVEISPKLFLNMALFISAEEYAGALTVTFAAPAVNAHSGQSETYAITLAGNEAQALLRWLRMQIAEQD